MLELQASIIEILETLGHSFLVVWTEGLVGVVCEMDGRLIFCLKPDELASMIWHFPDEAGSFDYYH